MKLATTSVGGIFGAIMFGSWEVLQFLGPVNPAISSEHDKISRATTIARIESHRDETQPIISEDADVEDDEDLGVNHRTLKRKVKLLRSGRDLLKTKKNYTAKLAKREVVHGELLEEQEILMKVQVQPFCVYLRWNSGDTGREVIYVDGAHNGKMIAHDGGWKSRLPAFYLEPTCSLAMRDARYPVTSAGLLFLIETMLQVHDKDLKQQNILSCQVNENEIFDGRPAISFVTCYRSKDTSPDYRKSVTVFDRESSVPLSTEHFEWPSRHVKVDGNDLDEATLIERYSFHELRFDQEISERDFDRSNHEYGFR